jgi:hypothetical protein
MNASVEGGCFSPLEGEAGTIKKSLYEATVLKIHTPARLASCSIIKISMSTFCVVHVELHVVI